MIRVVLTETTLTAKDHRGAVVVKVHMPIHKDTIISVSRYRKSFRISMNGITLWNVVSCVWTGDAADAPHIEKECEVAVPDYEDESNFTVLYLPR